MDYYVIYDLEDNIVSYCDNLEELVKFTHRRKKYFRYQFKKREFVYFQCYDTYLKIYVFFDFGEPDFEVETGHQNKMLNA